MSQLKSQVEKIICRTYDNTAQNNFDGYTTSIPSIRQPFSCLKGEDLQPLIVYSSVFSDDVPSSRCYFSESRIRHRVGLK